MWSRKLEEQIEALRSEMEQVATHYGMTDPKVYQLSLQLDHLHNQWQKEKEMHKNYVCHQHAFHVKECPSQVLYSSSRGA